MKEKILKQLGKERQSSIEERVGKAVFATRSEHAATVAGNRKFNGGEKAQVAYGVIELLQRCGQRPLDSDIEHFETVNKPGKKEVRKA